MAPSRLFVYAVLALAVLMISTSAILAKLSTVPPPVLAAYRLGLAVLLMLPFYPLWGRGMRARLSRRDWLYALLAGFFLAWHFVVWFASLRYTSVASSTVLVTLQPLFSLVGAYWLFGERVGRRALAGVALTLAGSLLIGWGDVRVGGMAFWGDVLALLGAALVTAYWLIGQHVRQRLSLYAYTLLVYASSTLWLVGYAVVGGYPLFPYPMREWVLFFLLALLPTLLGHTLMNWLIRWVSANVISMSILGEPVGAAFLAYWVFGEVPTWTQFLGAALILGGIAWFLAVHRPALPERRSEDPGEGVAARPARPEPGADGGWREA